jgi:predicted aconitase
MCYPKYQKSREESKVKKMLRALGITGAVALLFVPFAVGTPEYTKKESKSCVYCHTAVGKPDLNDAGKYYKLHRTLEGYVEKK